MDGIRIRQMRPEDESTINAAFVSQGWDARPGLFLRYIDEERQGLRQTFVAEREGTLLGYVTLLREAVHGPFAGRKWPEVSDFNVLIAYQRRGVGTQLMDAAEAAAAAFSDVVTIGVGLASDYGAAQRMYVKRGYIPDGSGVWYRNEQLPYYAPCCNDDDLVLYFSKPTRRAE